MQRDSTPLPNSDLLVCVVDDDPDMGPLIERWLSSVGYRARWLDSGPAALSFFETNLPDLVLIDLDLGETSGMDLLQRIRARDQAVGAIMLTASANVDHVVEAMRCGAFDYVVKPVDRRPLLEKVRSALDSLESARRSRRLSAQPDEAWHGIAGRSELIRKLRALVDRLAQSDVSVLIGGETGTGKELVARAVHSAGRRAAGPFVPVNCGAIPRGLQDSELFGHERGSFTGALTRRMGRFEQAGGGTLFLDEVAELDLHTQAALLRALQERRFFRVGGDQEVQVDVRILAATHADLPALVESGDFREDLYYRLAVFELEVPPLRARGDDVLLLARRFLAEAGGAGSPGGLSLAPETEQVLLDWPWPGNVRELHNAMERAAVVATGEVLPSHLPGRLRQGALGSPPVPRGPVVQGQMQSSARPRAEGIRPLSERDQIIEALRSADGNVSQAMRELGVPRTSMYRKLKRYGLLDPAEDEPLD